MYKNAGSGTNVRLNVGDNLIYPLHWNSFDITFIALPKCHKEKQVLL